MTRMANVHQPDEKPLVDRSGVAVLVAHPQYAVIPAAGVLLAECALGFA